MKGLKELGHVLIHISFLLNQFWRKSATHMTHISSHLSCFCFGNNFPHRLDDLDWFGPLPYTLWSSTLHTCRKRTNTFAKSGGWTSEFATFAVAGAIDLDSRYAGPLRVIRNEEWDENHGRMEGISWKILWLHSDCSAFWSVARWDLAGVNLAFLLEMCFRMASLVWRIVEAFLWLNPSSPYTVPWWKRSMNSNFIVLWIEIMYPFPIFLELMGLDDNGRQSIPITPMYLYIHLIYIQIYIYILHRFIHSFLSLSLSEAPARKSCIFRSGAAFAKSFAYQIARSLGRKVRFGFGDSERFESPSRAV